MARPLIVIPARLGATRLPGKPLADIAGEPMIVHVWRRACEADVGRGIVATDDGAIAAPVGAGGGYDILFTIQGDLPTVAAGSVRAALSPLSVPAVDIATIAAEITRA